MPIPTCQVTVTARYQNGDPAAGAKVVALLNRADIYDGLVVPRRIKQVADENGRCVLTLFRNVLGTTDSHYLIEISPGDRTTVTAAALVPDEAAVNLDDILIEPPEDPTGLPGMALWGRIRGNPADQADLLELIGGTAADFETLTGDPMSNAALATILSTQSDALVLAARYGSGSLRASLKAYGVSAEGPSIDKLPLIKAVEQALFAVAAATNQTAILVMDENYWTASPFLCRDRVSVHAAPGAGLSAMTTFVGADLFRAVPTVGKVNDALVHELNGLYLDAGRVGAHKGECTATKGSAVLTNVSFNDGYVPREFDVLTGNCAFRVNAVPIWIVAVAGGPGNWTLTVSANCEYDNFNLAEPERDAKTVFALEGSGSLKSGSGTAGQYWLTVNSLDEIKLGQRVLGNNLEADAVDLNQTSRVEEIDVPGMRVRLSRKIVLNGTYDLLFWTEVMVLNIDFADTAPGYNSNLKYSPVHTNKCFIRDGSGDLVVVRGGRDATHLNGGRASGGVRHGIYAIPSDIRFSMSVGECYGVQLNFRSGATPRSAIVEYYTPYNPAQPCVLALGVKELDFSHSDITGTVEIRGANGEPLSACNILHWNLKWGARCAHPDDTFPSAFIRTVNTAVINMTAGCVKGDPAQLPKFFYHRDEGGYLRVHDLTMEVAAGQPLTPYKTALTNAPQALEMRVFNPTTGLMYVTNPGGMLVESAYGAIRLAAAEGLTLGDQITVAGVLKYVDNTTIGFPQLTNGGTYNIPTRQIKTNVRNGALIASQTFVLPEPSAEGVNVYEICTLAGVTTPTVSAAGGRTVNNPYTSFAPGVVYKWALRPSNNQWYPSA